METRPFKCSSNWAWSLVLQAVRLALNGFGAMELSLLVGADLFVFNDIKYSSWSSVGINCDCIVK